MLRPCDQQGLDPVHAQFCAIILPAAERWQSGRMYLIRNQAYCKVPWVRIPPSPPELQYKPVNTRAFLFFSFFGMPRGVPFSVTYLFCLSGTRKLG